MPSGSGALLASVAALVLISTVEGFTAQPLLSHCRVTAGVLKCGQAAARSHESSCSPNALPPPRKRQLHP